MKMIFQFFFQCSSLPVWNDDGRWYILNKFNLVWFNEWPYAKVDIKYLFINHFKVMVNEVLTGIFFSNIHILI